jgi:two-component system, chemotaxis family, chemotaxis protein CheY
VLVVDDDLELLEALEDAVELLGHTPRIARNTDEAIALLERLPPCLVLLDSVAPSDSGQDFRAALRRRHDADQFRVALMSGWPRREGMERLPLVATLQKPFELSDLRALLDEHA